DLAPDVRGMAIKLPAVDGDFFPGGGQDFLLATADAFFGTDAVDYVDFIDASQNPKTTRAYFLTPHRLHGGLQLLPSLRIPRSPPALEFFSQTPYRLGPHCVKYCARPIGVRATDHDPPFMRTFRRYWLGLRAWRGAKLPESVPFDCIRDALIRD